jgi:hypothetical protein
MNKNINLTQLDPNQVSRAEHDSLNDAKRVILVGGEKLDISIDSDKIAKSISDTLAGTLNFQGPIESYEPQLNVITVEKQVFVPQIEYKTLEVPVIIKEIEYQEKEVEKLVYITEYKIIEVPVIVKEIEYKTLEVPVIVKEYIKEENKVPMWVKILLSGHGLTLLGLLISHFIK